MNDCIVVGAGIAGLLAAKELTAKGMSVVVLDKTGLAGGRMGTLRTETAVFDHGAQFFTARDPRFRAILETWLKNDVACEWGRGFVSGDGFVTADGFPRYRGTTGMRCIPRYLAQDLEVRLGDGVASASVRGNAWELRTAGGEALQGQRLLLTPPVPESLEILKAGGALLPPDAMEALSGIAYDPCIAVLAELDGPTRIPPPGGIRMPDDTIAWMADNRAKGISMTRHAVTIHANPNFTRQYWDEDTALVAEMLLGAARPWLGDAQVVGEPLTHRWPYSQPLRVHPAPCIYTKEPAPLAFAGDAFGGPRVEGAALSGLAAADHLA